MDKHIQETKSRFTELEINHYLELAKLLNELLLFFIKMYPGSYMDRESNRRNRPFLKWNDMSDSMKELHLYRILNLISYDNINSWNMGDSYMEMHGEYDAAYEMYDKLAVTLIKDYRSRMDSYYSQLYRIDKIRDGNEKNLENNSK